MSTPESKVKKEIKAVLQEYGIWYFMPQPGPFQIAGVPDFLESSRGMGGSLVSKPRPPAGGRQRTRSVCVPR